MVFPSSLKAAGAPPVYLAVRGALRSRFPLGQPISCLEPWDFIYLLHLGVRVVLRNVGVGLSCVCSRSRLWRNLCE